MVNDVSFEFNMVVSGCAVLLWGARGDICVFGGAGWYLVAR